MMSVPTMTRNRSDQGGGCDTPRPLWHHLAPRFTGERECLAAYLALEAAEVLGGAKPANLINLVDRERHCGRNLYRLWRRHGQTLLTEAGLAARELVQRDDGILLLIFHPGRLADYLATPRVGNFLQRAGYPQPAETRAVLDQLSNRFAGGQIPHEIGVVLGYPLKDVAGFMGWTSLPMTDQGPWKIFGDPRPSREVVAACRGCREAMALRLACCATPFECLTLQRLDRQELLSAS